MTLRHLLNRLGGIDNKSSLGSANKASRKVRSDKSKDKGVKGWEFRQASTFIRTVFNSSYVKCALPSTWNKFNSIDFIADSHSLLKFSDCGEMKYQYIPDSTSKLCIFFLSHQFETNFSTPQVAIYTDKFFALSK